MKKLEEYLDDCRERSDTRKPVFANVAGFCRYAGLSLREWHGLKRRFPAECELACAFFEDAALNSGATATLVGMYLRQYGFWGEPEGGEEPLTCEHDAFADGV